MTNQMNTITSPKRRPLSELNLMDDFLFQELLSQEGDGEEFCRILLSTILGRPIRKVRIIPQKNILGIDTNRHGIRMDAYIEDISEEENVPGINAIDAQIMPDIYDVEPNNKYEKMSLPKRMVYTIQNQCIEDPSVPYNDGATKIFLYTRGTEGNPSQELRDMLKYLERSIDDNVTNQDIDTIHQLVGRIKQRREIGINYMKSWELEQMYKQEGMEAGLEFGIEALISTCQELQVSIEETTSKIKQKFTLNQEQADEYIKKYWKKN